MVDRPTPRKPPHNLDIVLFDVIDIDFFDRILVATDNNRGTIDVKKQNLIIQREITNGVLFKSQVDARVMDVVVIKKDHGQPFLLIGRMILPL